jgi:signal transduction histidine kinase
MQRQSQFLDPRGTIATLGERASGQRTQAATGGPPPGRSEASPPPAPGPLPSLAGARPGGALERQHAKHICLVYERAAEARAAVTAFFAAGLTAGERCLYQGGAGSWRRIERGLAPGQLRGAPALGEISLPRGGGPNAWLDLLRDAERQALADGFLGLRVSWEMPPAAESGQLLELVETEERLDRALAGAQVSLLCRYSRQRSSAPLLQRALPKHPAAMIAGEVGANVFYEPERAGAGEAGAEQRVHRMLARLRRELRRDRQLRQLERQLAERTIDLDRADREREQLLAMLAHELRNPLSTVSIALSVLRLRGGRSEADATWRRALDTAERQVFHQAALVDDLIEASRATRGEIDLYCEPLDLAHLVPEAVDAYRDEALDAGLVLDAQLTAEPLPVSGDRPRLRQAVGHLLQNALKFSQPGGLVRVRLRRAAGGRAEISVRDSGVGISPELLPHVFEVFTQADHTLDRTKGGLGLGLAVVKAVIEGHGGEVLARSEGESGKGSEFKLLLPLDLTARPDEPAAAGRMSGAAGAAAQAARRVLVVEDNLDTAETLRDLLVLSGFEVEVAVSGDDGVAAAHQFHPDVVLCDLGLPGMNGYEVANALRHDPETAPVRLIALTGYGGDEDRRRSREAGFDVHLTKPVDPSLLRRLLSA